MIYYRDVYKSKTKKMSELEIGKISNILQMDGFKNFLNKFYINLKLLLNVEVLYAIGYMGFAILALSVHYFFYAYHLIEFIRSQTVLKNVLKSVYNPRWQLLFIFAFFILLEYLYSLVIYFFFHEMMPDNSCDSVFICLATVYTNTFTVI
jgi:hypothetical protein